MKKILLIVLLMVFTGFNAMAQEEKDEVLAKAQEAFGSGNYKEAIEYLKGGLPDHPEYYCYLGFIYQKMGDSKSASLCYKKAGELCPDKARQFFIVMAQTEEKANNTPGAFANYKRAVSMIDNYRDIYDIETGKSTDGKIDGYSRLMELHPKDHKVLKKLVLLYEGKGQYPQGISICKYILKENNKK
ncbi:MAG: tetratricopeptide repeat protein [Candidatus Eremiobacterota bacterium]